MLCDIFIERQNGNLEALSRFDRYADLLHESGVPRSRSRHERIVSEMNSTRRVRHAPVHDLHVIQTIQADIGQTAFVIARVGFIRDDFTSLLAEKEQRESCKRAMSVPCLPPD